MHPKRNGRIGASVLVLALGMLAVLGSGCAQPGPRADFYVAPNGNDAWSGKLPGPNAWGTNGAFATLHRARDAVRELKRSGRHQGPYVVMVRGGAYYLTQPLVLGPEDSGTPECPVIYTAYPGEQVTLSGGRPIVGWRRGRGDVWTTDVPGVRPADPQAAGGSDKGGWYFRQLFVGGKRQIRARTPNFDPQNPTTGGWCFVVPFEQEDKGKRRRGYHKDKFMFRPGDVEPWPRSPEPEIHIFPAWGWVNAILSVAKIDHAKRIVHVTNRNCSQELRPGNRYFVENVFEALDSPGEWHLDRAEGRCYYWPTDVDFAAKGVVAPALDRIIDLAGEGVGDRPGDISVAKTPETAQDQTEPRFVEHVVIRGFTFRHTTYSLEIGSVYSPDDGAVWLRRARHCMIEDCKFLGVGGYAVRLSDRASHNHILANTVIDAGQGGVLMIGHETPTQPKDNVVAGNHIRHCGTIWKHVAGVYVTTGGANRIAHNTITDVPRYGISLKTFGPGSASHQNVIEYNRLLRTNLETNDTGAIETLGRDRQDTGNVIRHNLILDAVGLKTSPTGEMLTPYYTWGIYLDDYSSGTEVCGNIVARTFRGGLHVHLGRNNVFVNNIFIDGRNQQAEYNGGQFMANNVFARNIVCYRTGLLHRVNRWHDRILAICENNLYWQVGGDLTESRENVTPKGPLAKWRQAGYDRTSIVADPLFVDPANDDYRLRPGSPALLLGFEPIDVARIGVEGYRRPPGLP